VEGPGVAAQEIPLVNRAGFDPARLRLTPGRVVGPRPTVVVAPGKSVEGVVRDRVSGQPIPGVRVVGRVGGSWNYLAWKEAVTDAAGRYRLDGLPKAARRPLGFDPPPGSPHVHRFIDIDDTEGVRPVRADVELERGVVVRGRLTDRVTGRPVRGRVVYQPLETNRATEKFPGYDGPSDYLYIPGPVTLTDAAGGYRLTVVPGPGVLFVRAWDGTTPCRFPPARIAPADQAPELFDKQIGVFRTGGVGGAIPAAAINTYRIIDPPAGATELTADFALDPGRERKGIILDPNGRPVAGAAVLGVHPLDGARTLPGAEFTAVALTPEVPRRVLVWHTERKLAGVTALRGDEAEPVRVRLQPCGAISGRAVKAGGGPAAGVRVGYTFLEGGLPGWEALQHCLFHGAPTLTDGEGRFRIEAVPAEQTVQVALTTGRGNSAAHEFRILTLRPGEARDLGDVRVPGD
jgi:hypothetical protein